MLNQTQIKPSKILEIHTCFVKDDPELYRIYKKIMEIAYNSPGFDAVIIDVYIGDCENGCPIYVSEEAFNEIIKILKENGIEIEEENGKLIANLNP